MTKEVINFIRILLDDTTHEKLRHSEELLKEDLDFIYKIVNDISSCQNDVEIELKREVPEMYFICNSDLNLWIGIAESETEKGTWFVVSAHKETIY